LIPLLSDKEWWQTLTTQLRLTFKQDKDFNVAMYRRQMAVLKGQAYNLLLSLQDSEEGKHL